MAKDTDNSLASQPLTTKSSTGPGQLLTGFPSIKALGNPLAKLGGGFMPTNSLGCWAGVIALAAGVFLVWVVALAFVGNDEAGYPDPAAKSTTDSGNTTGNGGGGNPTNPNGKLSDTCADIPKDYIPMINSSAGKWGISPAFLAAIARQESAFNPNAVSGSGARGMTQIMPETWDGLVENPPPAGIANQPFDAASGFYYGAKYIKQIQTYPPDSTNDLAVTAAKYNAGIGNVQQYGGIPPFPETQKYVRNVVTGPNSQNNGGPSFYEIYKKCLDGGSPTTTPTPPTPPTTQGDVLKIYLHWTAGAYGNSSPLYTYNIDADGKVINTGGSRHTYNRNTNSVGISVEAMANGTTSCYTDIRGSRCPVPITQAQLKSMVHLAAQIAKAKNIPIDQAHIMSHGEAGSLMDYPADLVDRAVKQCGTANSTEPCYKQLGLPHNNYGPYRGGTSERWEFYRQEDTLRQMIQTELASLQ